MKPYIVIKALDKLYQLTAEHFCDIIIQSLKERGMANVTISGGNTPRPLFELLTQSSFRDRVNWELIHFYWADERCVDVDHPESNYAQAKKFLFDKLPVRAENIHRIKGELEPSIAAEDYKNELRLHRSKGLAWPIMDYVLLGVGVDGHTASLFPGQKTPELDTKPVIVTSAIYMDRPNLRVTLTPIVFNTSRNIVFLVTGSSKADLVSKILNDSLNQNDYPVNWIRPNEGRITWFLDLFAGEFIAE